MTTFTLTLDADEMAFLRSALKQAVEASREAQAEDERDEHPKWAAMFCRQAQSQEILLAKVTYARRNEEAA